jgi:hypothetical protein
VPGSFGILFQVVAMDRTRLAEVNGGDLSPAVFLTGPFIRHRCLRSRGLARFGRNPGDFGLPAINRTKQPLVLRAAGRSKQNVFLRILRRSFRVIKREVISFRGDRGPLGASKFLEFFPKAHVTGFPGRGRTRPLCDREIRR